MIDIPFGLSGERIVAERPPKNVVDPWRPYDFLIEKERSWRGEVEDVATLFLTNRECPFRCLMCDLWKNTTNQTVPLGAIPAQINYALSRLPAAATIKLYNSGNFFDRRAIPPEDHRAIARRVDGFRTVIVENHPLLCTDDCLRFRDLLSGELEVALGLETAHPQVLAALNKQMTVDDFRRAAGFLTSHGIAVRTFLLLKPPFLEEGEAVDWAIRSLETAFDAGARCCVLIPTRSGNGVMERLELAGRFAPPRIESLEKALAAGLEMGRGLVFADVWDIARLATCRHCGKDRASRLEEMNLTQSIAPAIACECGSCP